MTQFIFVRHGESKSNENGTFTGQTDVALSALGKRQAQALKEHLLRNYTIDRIYVSDLKRAYDTVLPYAEAAGLPIQREPLLREINGGKWEGKPIPFIAETYPEDYARWCESIGLARCTGGESMAEVQARGSAALDRLAKESDGKTVLIGTHAGFLRAMQCLWQGLPLERMKDIPWVPNASVTEVRYGNGAPVLVRLADVSFLRGAVTELAKGI